MKNEATKVPEFEFNESIYEFKPVLKGNYQQEKFFEVQVELESKISDQCPQNYPIYCKGKCYQECKIGYLECNGKGSCEYFQPNVSKLYSKLLEVSIGEFECENKIDTSLQDFALSLLPNYGTLAYPYVKYNYLIYNWIKENVRYIPGTYSEANPPNITLFKKAGKCDDIAVLFASLSSSIGSIVRVKYNEKCQHAWPEVFFPSNESEKILKELSFYSKQNVIQYFEEKDGIWIPFDPTYEIGKILPECVEFLNFSIAKYYCKNPCENNYFYYNGSCYNLCPGGTGISKNKDFVCVKCPKDFPLTFNNTCVNKCPNGTGLAEDGKTCIKCPEGYLTFNNSCVYCPPGYYLGEDGFCYKK